MRILKRLIYGLVLLVILLAVFGLLLPDSAHMERSIAIKAPADKVFARVNDLRAFNDWSPWHGIDPKTEYHFEGPDSGVGAKVTWSSEHPDVGNGSQEIIESRANELVRTHLDFGPQGTAQAYFDLSPENSGTRIVWGFDTEFGFDIVGRYFGLMLESMIAPDYETGLAKLKQLVEAE